jgi:heterotetrameric sarcosine oxidase gamma subunit
MPIMLHAQPLVARTSLHYWHAAHGAHFTDRDGWQTVSHYSSAEREVAAAHTGLGLMDISALAKFSVRGSGLQTFAATLVPEGVTLNPPGVASVLGGSALACRLTEDHLLLLASTQDTGVLQQALATTVDNRSVVRTDVTSAYAGFMVIGSALEEFLGRLTSLDVRSASFPVNSCAETALARVEALLVRAPELSLPALRVYVAWDLAEYVWERMMETGREDAIMPIGWEALRHLR